MNSNKNEYVFANIQIPIQIHPTGEFNTMLERALIHFSECSELPPLQDHDSHDLLQEIRKWCRFSPSFADLNTSSNESPPLTLWLDPSEIKLSKKPLNASFKKYHTKTSKHKKSRIMYTHKHYSLE